MVSLLILNWHTCTRKRSNMKSQTPNYLFVGSKNPVKIQAVKDAVADHWPNARVIGHDAPSGVSEQPMSDTETREGSLNRARAALEWGVQEHAVGEGIVCLGVGLEGGVTQVGDDLYSTVWVSVVDRDGGVAQSNGARFVIPQVVAEPILNGGEMGPIVSQLVGEHDIRSKQGFIGIATNNFVTRTEEYASIAKMAIGLWFGAGWDTELG